MRKEACMGLYRLCLGHTADNKQGRGFLLPILSSLLTFLGDAIVFRPQQSSEVGGCLDWNWGGGGWGGLQETCCLAAVFSNGLLGEWGRSVVRVPDS